MTSVAFDIALRPVGEADRPFLIALYASTREAELDQVSWPPGVREAFVLQQFEAQDAWWHQVNPHASFDVVLLDGQPAGRLYVDRRDAEVRIIDISLVAECCGRGVGSKLIEDLIAECEGRGVPLTIHVEQFNRARRLYDRLGFRQVEERGVYLFLERPPQPKTA